MTTAPHDFRLYHSNALDVLAEVLAGVAYSQLIRKGAPVIFGAFVTSIDMNSGAPTFGTPEAAHITYGAGQLARRLGLPYRSGGSFCGSKLPDAQAAYETANTLNSCAIRSDRGKKDAAKYGAKKP